MSSECSSPSTKENTYVDSGGSEVKPSKSLTFAIVCIICTIANFYVFNAMAPPKAMTFRDVARLRRPSPFIGLDEVGDRSRKPLLIYPKILSKINQADPGRVYGDDADEFSVWEEFVPPVDREFKVTPMISTVVEFRSIDYRMETCELLLTTPPVMNSDSSFHLGSGDNRVNLWRLNVSYPMDLQTLSWTTRPPRARRLDTIAITPGMNYSYQFPCPSDSLHAFEFSATGDSIDVEWSQNHSDPNPAVVVMQHASTGGSGHKSPSRPTRERNTTDKYETNPILSWSIPEPQHVAMRIIPWTSYYELGSEAWKRLLPSSGHVIHLTDPDGTVSTHTVAMFHQLRCLDILQQSYLDEGSHRTSPLAQHCLNYIRQTLLCQMDLRNEEQGSHPTNNGADALCYDWEPIYEEAKRNYAAYMHYTSRAQST